MTKIKILEQSPQRLVIADQSRISKLVSTLALSGAFGAAMIGLGQFLAQQQSFTGSLSTLECKHNQHLTCKLTVTDSRGVLINQQQINKVEKTDILPILKTRRVCRGSGEDRECETVEYYECQIRLISANGMLPVPIRTLTQETSSAGVKCPLSNQFTLKFMDLISGAEKVGVWQDDTRIGDIFTAFNRYVAAFIPPIFLGLPLLMGLLFSRQRIWTFDKLTRTAELQTKGWWQSEIKTWSTAHLTAIMRSSQWLVLWEKQGDEFHQIYFLEHNYKLKGEEIKQIIASVQSFFSGELRSYAIGGYILDQTSTKLQLYDWDYETSRDYHGSPLWCGDRRTKKFNIYNEKSPLEIDWQDIQAVTLSSESVSLATRSGKSILMAHIYSEGEFLARAIGEFLGVPITAK